MTTRETTQLKRMHKDRLSQINDRVLEIMDRMTIEQKIGQMVQTERMAINPQEVFDHHIGSVLSGGGSAPGQNRPEDWVEMNDAYWEASMREDEHHLAIPLLYGVDAIHGHNNVKGAVVFPHNIGLGATRDSRLMQKIGKITAKEILATGVEWTFAPTLAVARNMCWGRTYESYSEDPAIVEELGAAMVKGLQNSLEEDGVIACVKHWVGDGGTLFGVDQGETTCDEKELHDIHIRPYYKSLKAGVLTAMVSFNSWNGFKCHGHHFLVTEVLKGRMGFSGFVISDWDGIDYLNPEYSKCVVQGINSGVDMFMVSAQWREFIEAAKVGVNTGTISMERIDDAVFRILRVKMAYGLWERPRPAERKWSNSKTFGSRAHRKVAEEAVRKSLVLLKNEDDILPLDTEKRVLVAGKNAADVGHQSGGFTIAWQGMTSEGQEPDASWEPDYHSEGARSLHGTVPGATSIWAGIKRMCPKAELDVHGQSADPSLHDAAIVVIGERPYAEGMGDIRRTDEVIGKTQERINGLMKVLYPYGRSVKLSELHPEDLALMKSIADKGIPVVAVFVGGRPLLINEELEQSKAFVSAWLPGSEGQAIGKVLFGKDGFRGKLSFTWPKEFNIDSENPMDEMEVLYPLGHGLTYNQ